MGRNQRKREENTQNQNISPPTRDHNSSPARKRGWTENECEEMMKSDFSTWVMRNLRVLKEHVLTQCKETKKVEKIFEEIITGMDNIQRNTGELMELKTQHKTFGKHAQVSTAELTKQKKIYQKLKINSMK